MPNQIAVRFEPPRGVSAAMAGALLDGRVGVREVGVMIVELAGRGWFTMEEESDGRWGLRSVSELPPRGDTCSPAEARLMDVVFRPGLAGLRSDACPIQYVSLTTIRHRLQGHVEEIATLVGQQIVDAGLMTKNPAKKGLGRRATLTSEGERVVAEIKGYRLYLTTAEAAALATGSLEEQFTGHLAYATALGVLDAWTARLSPGSSSIGMDRSALANPFVLGVGSSVGHESSLEMVFDVKRAENYGARFSR